MANEGAEEAIREPAPPACAACGGLLVPWRAAMPQEPTLRQPYLLYRCERCGSAATAGLPAVELHETGVYEAGTTRLHGFVETIRRGYERQRVGILRRALPPAATVLDAGAGQGRFVAAARAAGYEVTGFEPSRRAVEIAASRGIALQHASLEEAAVEPASVDAVALSHVLEHLDNPGAALDQIASWLRPGGILMVGVPNLASLQAKIGGARWLHLDVPRHRHHFTPAGLRTLLAAHGFTVEREHHLLLEHNPFGMWQAWADRLTTTPAYAYNLIKRNATPNARDIAATLAATVLAPLAIALELVAGLIRQGGTIAVIARYDGAPPTSSFGSRHPRHDDVLG